MTEQACLSSYKRQSKRNKPKSAQGCSCWGTHRRLQSNQVDLPVQAVGLVDVGFEHNVAVTFVELA
jgi:hypothetical protein